MSYDNPEAETNKLSKINSAGLINLRLHRLWEDCNRHSRAGKFLAWNGDLDRIWCELGGDVDEGKDTWNQWIEISKEIKKIAPLKNWKPLDGFTELDANDYKNKGAQFDVLMNKELFLRKLQNKQGKGTAYAESIEDYMDG